MASVDVAPIIAHLSKKIDIKISNLKFFLGMEVVRAEVGGIHLSQHLELFLCSMEGQSAGNQRGKARPKPSKHRGDTALPRWIVPSNGEPY